MDGEHVFDVELRGRLFYAYLVLERLFSLNLDKLELRPKYIHFFSHNFLVGQLFFTLTSHAQLIERIL